MEVVYTNLKEENLIVSSWGIHLFSTGHITRTLGAFEFIGEASMLSLSLDKDEMKLAESELFSPRSDDTPFLDRVICILDKEC